MKPAGWFEILIDAGFARWRPSRWTFPIGFLLAGGGWLAFVGPLEREAAPLALQLFGAASAGVIGGTATLAAGLLFERLRIRPLSRVAFDRDELRIDGRKVLDAGHSYAALWSVLGDHAFVWIHQDGREQLVLLPGLAGEIAEREVREDRLRGGVGREWPELIEGRPVVALGASTVREFLAWFEAHTANDRMRPLARKLPRQIRSAPVSSPTAVREESDSSAAGPYREAPSPRDGTAFIRWIEGNAGRLSGDLWVSDQYLVFRGETVVAVPLATCRAQARDGELRIDDGEGEKVELPLGDAPLAVLLESLFANLDHHGSSADDSSSASGGSKLETTR